MNTTHLDIGLDNAPDFVVHNYTSLGSTQASILLNNAYSLICVNSTGWANVDKLPSPIPTQSTARILHYPPPEICVLAEERARIYNDWAVPIGDKDDDVFTLDDLDEFDSTDLSFLFNIPPDSVQTRNRSSAPMEPPPRCGKQLKQDLYFLHDVIPQPHVHPSSSVTTSEPLRIVPYQKRKPIPIPPHTLPLHSPSPYARSAWVIPIRGRLPWDGCTPAIILDSSHQVPIQLDPKTDDPITWTHASLLSFWSFLLSIKDSCNVGSIGLSFHASPIDAHFSSQSTISNNTSPLLLGAGNQAALESRSESEPGSVATVTPALRISSSNVDHIKVYHEAPNAMHLRNILHLWSYTALAAESSKPEKTRVLKSARLALVDERSKGILIC